MNVETILMYASIGVIFVIGVLAWHFLTKKTGGKYAVTGIIFETRSDNRLYPVVCKAGRFREPDGRYTYKLKFKRFPFGVVKKMKPIAFHHLISGAGQFLFALRTSVDQIVPLSIRIENIKKMIKNEKTGKEEEKTVGGIMNVKVLDEDLRPFVIEETRRSLTRYLGRKSVWEKYQGVILIIVFALAVAIIMYGATGYIKAMGSIQILN